MRPRKRRRQIPFYYFQVFAFGSEQELVAAFGSLEEAESVWRSVRDEFLERWDLWGRPAAWWQFEPGVPDDIRSGPHAILTEADAAEWRRIEEARRRHLLSNGIDPAPHRQFVPFGSD